MPVAWPEVRKQRRLGRIWRAAATSCSPSMPGNQQVGDQRLDTGVALDQAQRLFPRPGRIDGAAEIAQQRDAGLAHETVIVDQ